MDDISARTAHLVGACGAGMKALAELLLDAQWSLTGSDLSPPNPSIQKLIERGLVFHQGHHETNVSNATRRLIYSSAIPAGNPERVEAKRRQLPQFSYSQMVAQLMRESTGVCVAGTHGKAPRRP
jgi:UDP-N-acetylmuramate--alanine ligase